MKTKLEKAAKAFEQAPKNLLDAMVEASNGGATNLEIAQAINFVYNPDYVGKLIVRAAGPRRPGRRPGSKPKRD